MVSKSLDVKRRDQLLAGRLRFFRRRHSFKRFDGMKWEQQNLGRDIIRLRLGVIHRPSNFIFENLCDGPKQLAEKPADGRNVPEQFCFDRAINFAVKIDGPFEVHAHGRRANVQVV